MPKPINLILDDINVPLEDLFKGDYTIHKVADMPDTYAVVKEEKEIN